LKVHELIAEIDHLDSRDIPAILAACAAKLAATRDGDQTDQPTASAEDDVLLTIEDVSQRLGKSKSWVYHQWRRLPFAVQGVGTPRFSKRALDKYIARNIGKTA
jgi:predicted DNA-binding transcriptional regulator AlpA